MRSFVAIFAALCCVSASMPAQSAKPRVVLLHPGAKPADTEAIVIPDVNPMRLVSFPRDFESNATFRGRFTLSGVYELGGYGDDSVATLWPDRKSRALLPYWRQRGGPREITISNPSAFARAVVPEDGLQKLKAKTLPSVRGQVTIIADDYRTSIECDVASFSARFVSVVKPAVKVADIPESEEAC